MQENFKTPKSQENIEEQAYFTPEQIAEIRNLSAETLKLLEELYGERGVLVYNLKKESEMLQNAKNNVNSRVNSQKLRDKI